MWLCILRTNSIFYNAFKNSAMSVEANIADLGKMELKHQQKINNMYSFN